ncbi:MAG: MFS transporter, partial [Spirochaetales bacterium]|nr:MFS transporter [Spirochaetales bacterium]
MLNKLKSLYTDSRAMSFLLSMLVFGMVTGTYGAVLNNYLHEILSISRLERGIVELPRELPGLLLFLIVGALYRFSEIRIMFIAMIVSFAGLIGLGFLGATRTPAIMLIVVFSAGEHMMMPIRSSIGIHMAKKGKEGLALGGLGSVANIGQVAGHYLVPVIFLLFPLISTSQARFSVYRATFFVAAAILIVGIILASRIKGSNQVIKRTKILFRKKFTKYYILEVFFGARKQVFMTFAPYVLIIKYGARTELIASLYGIWSLANIFLSPIIGRLIDRIGYKKILVADTVILFLLCILYGFAHHIFPEGVAFVLICCVFVLDAILFIAGMARTVYVKSSSDDKDEVTSTLSTGISINHLISIAIAIAGGILWERLGMEVLFSMAAIFALG